MKRETLERHTQLANAVMFYIYTHINTDINIDTLCKELDVGRFHMQRIFKDQFGRNIYETIQSIRLQKASNLLLTNRYSTITDVAALCGYASQSSFIRAFKSRFGMTPKAWRQGGYFDYSANIIDQSECASTSVAAFYDLTPTILKRPAMKAYYIRHRGYNKGISQTWQKLQTWLYYNEIENSEQIALFHDNPTITPLDECQYVACIVTDETPRNSAKRLPQFEIAEGVYARFDLQGSQGDLLQFIRWVYHSWLPKSEFETTIKPPYVCYRNSDNSHIDGRAQCDLSFYLSVRY